MLDGKRGQDRGPSVRGPASARNPMGYTRDPRRLMVLPALSVLCFIVPWLACRAQTAAAGPRADSSDQASRRSSAQDSQEQQLSELAVPLPKGKKLILTDGTFHVVREYRREGNRVRYYSLERSDWEEVPASLVDWEATQKAEEEREAQQKEFAEKIKASETAARVADLDVDTSFEVRAGVFLPDQVGLYAVDGATVTQMEQEKAQVHLDKGRAAARIITGVPFISTKQYVEIPGKHAKIRIHSSDPEFYFRTADKREPKITLLHTDVQGDKRSLESLNTNLVGQVSYKNHEVSLLQWDAARGLYRFTVEQVLEPGEYAMVETTQREGQSMYVWTFGVDSPAATKGAIASPAKPASH
jgi:hypothetical protein